MTFLGLAKFKNLLSSNKVAAFLCKMGRIFNPWAFVWYPNLRSDEQPEVSKVGKISLPDMFLRVCKALTKIKHITEACFFRGGSASASTGRYVRETTPTSWTYCSKLNASYPQPPARSTGQSKAVLMTLFMYVYVWLCMYVLCVQAHAFWTAVCNLYTWAGLGGQNMANAFWLVTVW